MVILLLSLKNYLQKKSFLWYGLLLEQISLVQTFRVTILLVRKVFGTNDFIAIFWS